MSPSKQGGKLTYQPSHSGKTTPLTFVTADNLDENRHLILAD